MKDCSYPIWPSPAKYHELQVVNLSCTISKSYSNPAISDTRSETRDPKERCPNSCPDFYSLSTVYDRLRSWDWIFPCAGRIFNDIILEMALWYSSLYICIFQIIFMTGINCSMVKVLKLAYQLLKSCLLEPGDFSTTSLLCRKSFHTEYIVCTTLVGRDEVFHQRNFLTKLVTSWPLLEFSSPWIWSSLSYSFTKWSSELFTRYSAFSGIFLTQNNTFIKQHNLSVRQKLSSVSWKHTKNIIVFLTEIMDFENTLRNNQRSILA